MLDFCKSGHIRSSSNRSPYRIQCNSSCNRSPYRIQCNSSSNRSPYRIQCNSSSNRSPYRIQCNSSSNRSPYRIQCNQQQHQMYLGRKQLVHKSTHHLHSSQLMLVSSSIEYPGRSLSIHSEGNNIDKLHSRDTSHNFHDKHNC